MSSAGIRAQVILLRLFVAVLAIAQLALFLWLRANSSDFVARQLNVDAIDYARSAAIETETILLFVRDSSNLGFLGAGWHPADTEGVWSRNRNAWLLLRIPPDADRISIDLELGTVPVRGPDDLKITLLSHGTEVARWHVEPAQQPISATIALTREQFPDDIVELHFRIDSPRSPWRQGIGHDRRMLGVQLRSATIREHIQTLEN